MASTNKYVPRVNQIDAIHLNNDVTRLIRANLHNNLHAISPVLFLKIQPELDLAIEAVIWFGSVGKQCSTFGQQLLVLAYDSEHLTTFRLCLHFLLTCLPSYIKSLERFRVPKRIQWLHKLVTWGENAAMVFTIFNFFRFIKTGRKPTPIDFLLGLDYVSLRHNQRRDIAYKYLTRELLWGGFMEILAIVLPIINFKTIEGVFRSISWYPGGDRNSKKVDLLKTSTVLPSSVCSYCGERPTLPRKLSCGHMFCYFCVFVNKQTETSFICNLCDSK